MSVEVCGCAGLGRVLMWSAAGASDAHVSETK